MGRSSKLKHLRKNSLPSPKIGVYYALSVVGKSCYFVGVGNDGVWGIYSSQREAIAVANWLKTEALTRPVEGDARDIDTRNKWIDDALSPFPSGITEVSIQNPMTPDVDSITFFPAYRGKLAG